MVAPDGSEARLLCAYAPKSERREGGSLGGGVPGEMLGEGSDSCTMQ